MATIASGGGTLSRLAQLTLGAKKAEDEEDKDKDAKSKKAEDEEEPDDKKAEEEEEEYDDSDDKTKKKGKKAKAKKAKDDEECAEDDEDGDMKKAEKEKDEDHDDSDEKGSKKKAAAGERRRIAAIMMSPEAQLSEAHVKSAWKFALTTDCEPKMAIAMLSCMSAPSKDTQMQQERLESLAERKPSRERLSHTPNHDVGTGDGGGKGPSLAAQIIAAGNKARGGE